MQRCLQKYTLGQQGAGTSENKQAPFWWEAENGLLEGLAFCKYLIKETLNQGKIKQNHSSLDSHMESAMPSISNIPVYIVLFILPCFNIVQQTPSPIMDLINLIIFGW